MKRMKKFFLGILVGTGIVSQFVLIQYVKPHKPETAISTETETAPHINWNSVPKISNDLNDEDNKDNEDIVVKSEATKTGKPTADKAKTIEESNFKSDYAYSTLSEEDKLLYNEMYTSIFNYEENVLLTTTSLDRLEDVFYCVDADHPEIYWCDGYTYKYYKIDGEITAVEFKPTYTLSRSEIAEYNEFIEQRITLFLSGIKADMSDYEKSKYVYETLINNVDYDHNTQYNQTIISALLYGKTVCKGYACTAQYLLNRLGIESVVVSGKSEGESHAWNAVKLDNEWYYMDVTWGNSTYFTNGKENTNKYIDYSYLNITESELLKTHTIEEHFETPKCNSINDNYYIKEGLYIDNFDPVKIGTKVAEVYNNGYKRCSLKFSDKKLYDESKQFLIKRSGIYTYCFGLDTYSYIENETSNIITFNFKRKEDTTQ